MRLDNTVFTDANAQLSKRARYVIGIDFDGTIQYLTSHDDIANVPGSPIEGVIEKISATSQTLNPDRANATIGSMSFNIVDHLEAFTNKVRTELDTNDVGLRGRTVTFHMGYVIGDAAANVVDGGSTDDDPDFENFALFQTQIIDGADTKDGGYSIQCSDIQRDTKKQIFESVLTYLTTSISDVDTTIPCLDVSGFEGNVHGTSYTEAPSTEVVYIQIDTTKEIIRCPVSGISGNDFTGCTRGVFGTRAQSVEVDASSASDRRPKVLEYVYLELPAVKMALAILTGEIHGTANVLPSGWHAAVDTAFVRTSDFETIGDDLWDTSDDTAGVILRFDGVDAQDAKKFLETEIYLLLGLFSPVYADGSLGLRRMVPALADSPYSFELTDNNVSSTGRLMHDMSAVQNNIRVDWAWNGERFIRSTIVVDAASIIRHKIGTEKRLGFRGLSGTRFTEQVVRQLLTSLRDMYTGPPLRLEVNGFLALNQVEVGDAGRVNLPGIRDYTQSGSGLNRTMMVHGMSVNWLSGVKLKLFGSSERADEIPPVEATTSLEDAFYTDAGVSLSTIGGLMSGNITNAGTFTLSGHADMNNPAAVFYWDDDLTISVGTTLLLEDNVQLRVKGFVTLNGAIDGVGGGRSGAVNLYDAGQHFYWTDDRNVGLPGFIGNSNSHPGLLFRYPDDGGFPDWVWSVKTAVITEGLHQAFPNLVLQVEDAGNGSVIGIPTDMRGGAGSYGTPAGEKVGLSGRTYQRASGGAGGAGGAALCIISRGGDFGVGGSIVLDGDDGVEPAGFYAEPGGDYDIYGGTGGAGVPGALLWLLDGSGQTFPDLAGHFQAITGEVPAQYALPLVNGQGNQSLSDNSRPRKNMSAFNPFSESSRISGHDQTGVNFRIQYLPIDLDPEDDQEEGLPPPTNFTATSVNSGVQLFWDHPAIDNVVVDVYMADTQDRAVAVRIASTTGGAWIDPFDPIERASRRYWLRTRNADDDVSIWTPDNTVGLFGQPLESRANFVLDPEFNIGNPAANWQSNGNGSQTEFWRANCFPNGGTATADHQPTEGEDGGVAIDIKVIGATADVQLQSKKWTRFQNPLAVFQFVIKYKTVGSVDSKPHADFLTYIQSADAEFGGGSSAQGGQRLSLPRSAAWNTVRFQQKVAISSHNFVSWQIAISDPDTVGTEDTLRIDSIFVYQVGGDEFGDNVQDGDVQAGIVPKALASETAKYLKGDGTWDHPTGTGVDSFNGRVGAVVPLQGDYDSFFLTPAEGNAAYAAIGHNHSGVYEPVDATLVRDDDAGYNNSDWDTAFSWGNHAGLYSVLAHDHDADYAPIGTYTNTFNGRSGTVVPIQADYDSFFLTPAEGNAAYAAIGHNHSGVYEPVDATLVRDDDAGYNNSNWDTAYGWGDHSGVYLPIGGGTLTGGLSIDTGGMAVTYGDITTTFGGMDCQDGYTISGKSFGKSSGNFLRINDSGQWVQGVQIGSNLEVEGSLSTDIYGNAGNWFTAFGWGDHAGLYAPAGTYTNTFNGRSGAVVPIQADYDSFFLTPAEGNAAYAPLAGINYANWDTAFGWGDHGAAGYTTGGPFLPLAGGTLTGNLNQVPSSASISNIMDVTSDSYDVDVQYKIGGTLTALFRWDSSINQFSWMDRDPSPVTQMTLDLDTGDLSVEGNLSVSYGDITTTFGGMDCQDGYTISGKSFGKSSGNFLRINDSIQWVQGVQIGSNLEVEGSIGTDSYGNSGNWFTAYGWGDHGAEGYLPNGTDAFYMSADAGDRISIYDNRLNSTSMYGWGVEGDRLYTKANGGHRWYIGANADSGASEKMALISAGLIVDGYVRAPTGSSEFNQIKVNDIYPTSGQHLVLSAGESISYRTGQTNEYVYLNAESGIQINSSPDNWASGWAGRKTATLTGTQLTIDGSYIDAARISQYNVAYANWTHANVTTDMDDFISRTMFRVDAATTNSPNGAEYLGAIVYGNNGNVTAQLATDRVQGTTWTRGWNGVSWSAWRRMWHDGDFSQPLELTGGTLTAPLTIDTDAAAAALVIGDGSSSADDILLHFNIDRDWTFRSLGDGSGNKLELRSEVDKNFVITDLLGDIQHQFYTASGNYAAGGEIVAGSISNSRGEFKAFADNLTVPINDDALAPGKLWLEGRGGYADWNIQPYQSGLRLWPSGGSAASAPHKFDSTGAVYHSGVMTIDSGGYLRIETAGDASAGSTAHGLQIGPTASTNLIIDNNEIGCRNNGADSIMYMQEWGGSIQIGGSGQCDLTLKGDFRIYDQTGGADYVDIWMDGNDGNINMQGIDKFRLKRDGSTKIEIGATSVGILNDLYVSGAVNIGHASDTTLKRYGAALLQVEDKPIFSHIGTAYNSAHVTFSSSAPSGGDNGDVWYKF